MDALAQDRRRIDGVLLLDKPLGITSQTAVSHARRLLRAAKAGHTGTLDPMASGLLPVCFGEATKFSQLLLDSDKTYEATIRLGVTTVTGDAEGEVIARTKVVCDRSQIEMMLPRFRGQIMQTPPMHSALKHAGQPLYKYARAGKEIPRQARPVNIIALEALFLHGDELGIRVTCSKGTYIRVLAEDIGHALGCGASLAALRRTAVGTFRLEAGAVGLGVLECMTEAERATRLLPVDALVDALPRVDLDPHQARLLVTGRAVRGQEAASVGLIRVYGPQQAFLGVAEVRPSDLIVARRLLAQAVCTGATGGCK